MGRVSIAVVVVLMPLKAKLWTGILPDTLHWLLLLGDKFFFSEKITWVFISSLIYCSFHLRRVLNYLTKTISCNDNLYQIISSSNIRIPSSPPGAGPPGGGIMPSPPGPPPSGGSIPPLPLNPGNGMPFSIIPTEICEFNTGASGKVLRGSCAS